MAFIYILAPIVLCIILSPCICKFLGNLHNYFYDKQNNIKTAKIVPLEKANLTSLEINTNAIEIESIEPFVVYYY